MKIPWLPEDHTNWLKEFQFFLPIQVRFSDFDMLGHINNVNFIRYFEMGRLAYMEELHLTEELFSQEQFTVVVANIECQYMKQVKFATPIKLGVKVSNIGNSSLQFQYAVIAEEHNLTTVGRGNIVKIDRTRGKSHPLSEKVRSVISSFEKNVTVKSQQ